MNAVVPFQEQAPQNRPPHSMQAEQAMIGALLLDGDTWDQVGDRIDANNFYFERHRLIFSAIVKLVDSEQPIDIVTVGEYLDNQNKLVEIGDTAYLSELVNTTPSTANICAYADIIKAYALRRQLMRAAAETLSAAADHNGCGIDELLDTAESKVFKIAEQRDKKGEGFQGIKGLLVKTVDRIETLYQSDDPFTGISTGFDDLDAMTSGLQPADLVIVAGRTSMGKTTFAMNIAENVAIKSGMPVAVFSLEMPGESLTLRMYSSLGRINHNRIRSGNLKDDEWPRLTSAVSVLSETKLFIDDSSALTAMEIRVRCRRLMRQQGQLGLVVIDYLGLMAGEGDTQALKIGAIVANIKALAKELEVPVILLVQLNRGPANRKDQRPVLTDLRDSGEIEQHADTVLLLYRDEVYNEDTEDKGIAEVELAKQRNGPTGTIKLTYLGKYMRFENLAPGAYGSI